MKKTSWLLFFLSLLIPLGAAAQNQDIHALSVVTRAFEKAKEDNKIRRDTVLLHKTHRIENLRPNGQVKSPEKQMVYRAYSKTGNSRKEYVEELVGIWPPRAESADNPLDFDKMLDIFLIRFYFSINPEKEIINGRTHIKVNFWSRGDHPIKENTDHLINVLNGVLYIDEKTLMLRRINGSMQEVIDQGIWFYMDKFDFNVEVQEWNGLGLITTMRATTRYQYRNPKKDYLALFKPSVKRHQVHRFWYEYSVPE